MASENVLASGIDYLRVVGSRYELGSYMDILKLIGKGLIRGGSMLGYDSVVKSGDGVMSVCVSSTREDMGVMIDIPGKGMASLRALGIGDEEVVGMLNGRSSRIDVAIDVRGTNGVEPVAFWAECIRGKKRGKSIVSEHGTETHYIGARSSERYTRIYNKALESGMRVDEVAWTRIEFELKGKVAHAAQSSILGGESVGNIARGLIERTFEGEYVDRVARGVGDGSCKLKPQRDRIEDNMWLFRVAAKALARKVALGSVTEEEFSRAYHYWLASMNEEIPTDENVLESPD